MKTFCYNTVLFFLIMAGGSLNGCKKFIEVAAPVTSVNEGNVYENDGTAISTVVGIYTNLSSSNIAGQLTFYPELSADNLKLLNQSSPQHAPYYQNNLLAGDGGSVPKPWILLYPRIFNCNAIIEGVEKSQTITLAVKQNLLGQVYFLRAFFYFYLVNFYGDIPLAISTDYTVNNTLKRASASLVYDQIISDLKRAQSMLPEGYLTGDMKTTFANEQEQRVTPNRSAASALLARVYIYQKDWSNAEAMATEVIGKTTLYSASIPLSQVFLKNSRETIWALQPVAIGGNASEADLFVLRAGEPTVTSGRSAHLSDDFMRGFQTGDQRKAVWVGTIQTGNTSYPFPFKYRALFNAAFTEQSILLRLSEQFLIRAEARIQLNKIVEGIADLNAVRDRAIDKSEQDLDKRLKPWSTSLSKEEAILALNYERRMELFAEGAHRWFDLKRNGQVNAVMTTATQVKGGTWSDYKALYPLPASELTNNTSLTQNRGYTN